MPPFFFAESGAHDRSIFCVSVAKSRLVKKIRVHSEWYVREDARLFGVGGSKRIRSHANPNQCRHHACQPAEASFSSARGPTIFEIFQALRSARSPLISWDSSSLDHPDRMLNFIRTSIYDKFSGSTNITTHLDHITHRKASPGTHWLNSWKNRSSIMNTHRD